MTNMTKLCDICHKENALPNFKVCQKHYDQIMIMRNALAFETEE
jgi:hypothetical protein